MWPVYRHLFGRRVLWIWGKKYTDCDLSARVLALQCLRGGLPRGRLNPVTDSAADDGLLQVARFSGNWSLGTLQYFDFAFAYEASEVVKQEHGDGA